MPAKNQTAFGSTGAETRRLRLSQSNRRRITLQRQAPGHSVRRGRRDNDLVHNVEPDFIVIGERVALGPLRRDLASTYARWMNQLDVRRGLDFLGVATPENQEKWVDDNIDRGCKREPDGVEFTIYDRADSTPVGTAGLFHISHVHGRAEFGIAIGERRGQGLGTEATRLVLDFAFHVLQLRNVLLETLEWNVAGQTAYERAGFRRIGIRRAAALSRGRPTNVVLMDAIPQDFGQSILQ